MCIVAWIWLTHPKYPILLLFNRDEYHVRPTKPLQWWGEENLKILGGRDDVAGGTWLGCTKDGRLAFLTNFREPNPSSSARSRGNLPLKFLQALRLHESFKDVLKKYGDEEIPEKDVLVKLMNDTVKADFKLLPVTGCDPELEFRLSSIFVDTDSKKGQYGTRSTASLFVKSDGEVSFYERHLDVNNGVWKEYTVKYHMDNMK